MSRESDIKAVLSHLNPDAKVQVIPEPDGSRIVVETGGRKHWLSIGKGRSPLLNYLLTGSPTSDPPPRGRPARARSRTSPGHPGRPGAGEDAG
jgi:hypothetical protein